MQALYYKPGASRARIQNLDTQLLAEATISEYRHKLNRTALRRLAQKQHDLMRCRPPAWDPPKLLLVIVSRLHEVVGTSRVVVVIVDGGIWLLGSNVWSQQSGIEKGKRGRKETVSTHPKYSQARSYTTYICIGIK